MREMCVIMLISWGGGVAMRRTGWALGMITAGIYAAFTEFFASVFFSLFDVAFLDWPLGVRIVLWVLVFMPFVICSVVFCVMFVTRLMKKNTFSLLDIIFFPMLLLLCNVLFKSIPFNLFDNSRLLSRRLINFDRTVFLVVKASLDVVPHICLIFTIMSCLFLYQKDAPVKTRNPLRHSRVILLSSIAVTLLYILPIFAICIVNKLFFSMLSLLPVFFYKFGATLAVGIMMIFIITATLRKKNIYLPGTVFFSVIFIFMYLSYKIMLLLTPMLTNYEHIGNPKLTESGIYGVIFRIDKIFYHYVMDPIFNIILLILSVSIVYYIGCRIRVKSAPPLCGSREGGGGHA